MENRVGIKDQRLQKMISQKCLNTYDNVLLKRIPRPSIVTNLRNCFQILKVAQFWTKNVKSVTSLGQFLF